MSPAMSSRTRIVGGIVALAVAAMVVIGLVATRPPSHSDAEAGVHPGVDEVITPIRFSSGRMPALSIDAPAGWHLTYDLNTGKLEAFGQAALMIKTVSMTGTVDSPAIVKEATDLWLGSGATTEGSFTEAVDGLGALGASVRFAAHSAAVWVVQRGDRLVTTMVCKNEGTGAREACRNVLATLRWRPPAPP